MNIKNEKSFLITVDTEADNQWDPKHEITTENARYLPRFQDLCEKYGFRPVWLTNYEMAMDSFFVSYMKERQLSNACEIGMHLHAWYTPPEYPLKKINEQREYLIEYPMAIMDKKIKTMTELLEEKFGKRPVSHRSGRWALDERYFELLKKYGYTVDCSVTPYLDWTNHVGATGCPGSNYSREPTEPHYVNDSVLEVPLTIRKVHCFEPGRIKSMHSFLSECKKVVSGRYQWLRPDNTDSNKGNMELISKVSSEKADYMMFMIHSSELMPGGSPTFPTEESIEILYHMIEEIFDRAAELGYEGKTLGQYYQNYTIKGSPGNSFVK